MARKKLNVATKNLIFKRSQGFCECCGMDITADNHHILEVCKDGSDNSDNLLALCPSCHRQIPQFLNEKQQKELQEWHNNQVINNRHANHCIYARENSFMIGADNFKFCNHILVANGQSIIMPYEKNGRFYLNIVMLKDFEPKILVLANKVIFGSPDMKVESKLDHLTVKRGVQNIYQIYQENGKTRINMNFVYKGKSIYFGEENNLLGLRMINNTFGPCEVAINLQ